MLDHVSLPLKLLLKKILTWTLKNGERKTVKDEKHSSFFPFYVKPVGVLPKPPQSQGCTKVNLNQEKEEKMRGPYTCSLDTMNVNSVSCLRYTGFAWISREHE